ncbi:NADH:ubiquinone reductase (Na(+)-transporting) subunit B [Rapidithrix thailandica]|uniref:Na(+)-translocating NADH-quinone reductase subunit B n=1 Tax=Rapidithrix thailandica TaxID=413964 RepID=A0AAW9SDP2_9BACT
MKFLHDFLQKQKPMFEKGGKFEKLHYLFDAQETFLFTPPAVTKAKGVQVRDAIDLKRMMMTVIIALIPCLLFGLWNVGHQHFLAVGDSEASFGAKFWIGLREVLPIIIVSYASGGLVEAVFAVVRKHPLTEGFLVTGILIPLVLPVTIPLWQVAMATIFAVVIAKEVFGGVGMNILNVALTARAFLYFAYPTDISGEIWTFLGEASAVDGYSGATYLGIAATAATTDGATLVGEMTKATSWAPGLYDFWNMFLGLIPGSIGETSTLMCLIGAAVLVLTRVGSGKIILSVFVGAYVMGFLFNLLGLNDFMTIPPHHHWVIGGLAFGAVFMATDPVTASQTETGKWIYGFLIGFLTVLIRVFNPAYPEGIMLAILLMNVFAPLIDFYVVKANKKRRLSRATV